MTKTLVYTEHRVSFRDGFIPVGALKFSISFNLYVTTSRRLEHLLPAVGLLQAQQWTGFHMGWAFFAINSKNFFLMFFHILVSFTLILVVYYSYIIVQGRGLPALAIYPGSYNFITNAPSFNVFVVY